MAHWDIFVIVRPLYTGGLKASVHITSTYQETTKQSPVSTVFTPMFEKTYFTYFSDFKKHDFLRFLDGASKSHKTFYDFLMRHLKNVKNHVLKS